MKPSVSYKTHFVPSSLPQGLPDGLRQKLLLFTAVFQIFIVLLPASGILAFSKASLLSGASEVFKFSPIQLVQGMPLQFAYLLWGAVLVLSFIFSCYQYIEPQCKSHPLYRKAGPWMIWSQACLSTWVLGTSIALQDHFSHLPQWFCSICLASCLLMSWLTSFIALVIVGRWATDEQQAMTQPERWLLVPYLGVQSAWLSLMLFVHASAFFQSTWSTFWKVPSIFGIGTLLFFFVGLILLLGYIEGFKSLQRWYAGTLAYGTLALSMTCLANGYWFSTVGWLVLCLLCVRSTFKPVCLKQS